MNDQQYSQGDLRTEFRNRLENLKKEGLVDFKAEVDVNNNTSVRDLVVVYNNFLRLREEGELKPAINI